MKTHRKTIQRTRRNKSEDQLDSILGIRATKHTDPAIGELFPACHHRNYILRDGGYECVNCGMPRS